MGPFPFRGLGRGSSSRDRSLVALDAIGSFLVLSLAVTLSVYFRRHMRGP